MRGLSDFFGVLKTNVIRVFCIQYIFFINISWRLDAWGPVITDQIRISLKGLIRISLLFKKCIH